MPTKPHDNDRTTAGEVRYLSPERVGRMLDVKADTIRAWVRRGSLPGVQIGRCVRIEEGALWRWLHGRGPIA